MQAAPKGLLIVPRRDEAYRADFEAIAHKIGQRDSDIVVRIVHGGDDGASIAAALEGLPTLSVVFDSGPDFSPPGRVFACRHIIKTAQLRQYAEAHLPTPMSCTFHWGMSLDPRRWGELLVMKPLDPHMTSQGIVHLIPTALLSRLEPRNFAGRHPIHTTPMLLQKFIDTGPNPSHYRVLTLFGEPLYAVEHVMVAPRPPLDSDLQVLLAADIATNGGARHRRLIADPDVLDFARRMARALPAIPLQGIDIMREQPSGRLFAIENNTGGNTWHFSSRMGEELREQIGRQALIDQFDAFERAAEVLVAATRRFAR